MLFSIDEFWVASQKANNKQVVIENLATQKGARTFAGNPLILNLYLSTAEF